MKMFDITGDTYPREVEEYSGKVLLDFSADWCSPCKSLTKVIESMDSSSFNNVKFCKVNIDSEKDLVKKFGIMSVPTLVVIENGKVKNRSIGVTGKKAIMDMLE